MAKLVITREGADPEEVVLGEVTIVGRDESADVVLASEAVSRHHAKIACTEDGYLVEDLWSRNATFVDRPAMIGSMVMKLTCRPEECQRDSLNALTHVYLIGRLVNVLQCMKLN